MIMERAQKQPDLFDFDPLPPRKLARRSDPDTSLEAAESINVTAQARIILSAYVDGKALLDVDAYRRAGFPPHACDGQRCSDLRRNGLIERTGEKASTPSGRRGHLCVITEKGRRWLRGLRST